MVAGASGAGGRALVVAGGVGDALFVGVVGGGEPAAVWITQRGAVSQMPSRQVPSRSQVPLTGRPGPR
jgi:hypothetical protein